MSQSKKDKSAVQAFFYSKIAEGMSVEAAAKLIQMSVTVEKDWIDIDLASDLHCDNFGINWYCSYYRIKPKTVIHPGGEYQEPCRDVDAISNASVLYGPSYKMLESGVEASVSTHKWNNRGKTYCDNLAKSGLYHLTEEAALQHAEVLYGVKNKRALDGTKFIPYPNDEDEFYKSIDLGGYAIINKEDAEEFKNTGVRFKIDGSGLVDRYRPHYMNVGVIKALAAAKARGEGL